MRKLLFAALLLACRSASAATLYTADLTIINNSAVDTSGVDVQLSNFNNVDIAAPTVMTPGWNAATITAWWPYPISVSGTFWAFYGSDVAPHSSATFSITYSSFPQTFAPGACCSTLFWTELGPVFGSRGDAESLYEYAPIESGLSLMWGPATLVSDNPETPLPATLPLFGGGLLVLFGLVRSRKR